MEGLNTVSIFTSNRYAYILRNWPKITGKAEIKYYYAFFLKYQKNLGF